MIQGFPKKKEPCRMFGPDVSPKEHGEMEQKDGIYCLGRNQAIDECKSAYFKKLDKEKIKDVVFFPPYYPTEETWDEWSTKATQAFIDYMKGGI